MRATNHLTWAHAEAAVRPADDLAVGGYALIGRSQSRNETYCRPRPTGGHPRGMRDEQAAPEFSGRPARHDPGPSPQPRMEVSHWET